MAKLKIAPPLWEIADYRNKLCAWADVGTPKPALEAEKEPFSPPMEPIPDESIQEMLRKAYYAIGGDVSLAGWARNNPTEFYKLFLKPQPNAQPNTVPPITIVFGGDLGRLIEARRDLLVDPSAQH